MADQPKPPLWLVMDEAAARADYLDHPYAERVITAAEIRALADWLVPRQEDPPCGDKEPWPAAYQARSDAMWEQRQILRQLLLTEADRAETGDG